MSIYKDYCTSLAGVMLACMLVASMSAEARKQQPRAAIVVTDLRTENMQNPMSIDTPTPRLGWRIESSQNDVMQTAYHLIVASTPEKAEALEGDLWDVSKETSQSQWIAYSGRPLRPDTRCYWRVQVTTTKGTSDWSKVAMWNVGLLNESDWRGSWIGYDHLMPWDKMEEHSRLSSRYLRTQFPTEKAVKRATLYISGLGLYECYIDGQRIGDRVLTPAPTDYRRTVLFDAYDVTPLLQQPAEHCIGVVLGNGRYFTMQQDKKPYKITRFGFPTLRLNLVIHYEDGSRRVVDTNEKQWRVCVDGPLRSNNEYDGEVYDARKALEGWTQTGFDDSAWLTAERTAIPYGTLRGTMMPGMKVLREMTPVSVNRVGDHFVVDMGQNMAGWLKLNVGQLSEGDSVVIRFAEKLDANGNIWTENFRHAESTDRYYANGRETADTWWAPVFSYHGFRYAEVTGLKRAAVTDFVGQVVADEMESTGQFECSDTILNKVMRNAWWGVLDNYKGMPVDCPQRDERQPWLGDRTMGSLGESFLFDNERLYTKWMRDICEAQREDGCIPDVAPAYWNYYSDNVTWPAALPFTCDMLWRQYGNRQPIEQCYPNIKRWLMHIINTYGKEGIITKDRYGDWCVPPEKLELIHSEDPARQTDGALISTAYVIRVMQLMEQWGCEPDLWKPLREEMTSAFNRHFLTVHRGTSPRPGHVLYPDSVFYGNNTATANLLPMAIGIVPDDCRTDVARQVVENICIQNKGHVSCGVIGISWLLRGLSDNGFADVAWLLATQKSYPSWGYMAQNGATTIWELWNGDKASPKMNSGNHVMLLGDLLTWCYQYVGGIRQVNDKAGAPAGSAIGYKHFRLQPAFDIPDCEWTNVSYKSLYGPIVSRWKKTLQHLEWDVEVPCNTQATVCLPDGRELSVGSGQHHFSSVIPSPTPSVITNEFLYDHTFFPEAHAGTIVETKKGDLVAAYFGGTHERDPDVCIYVNIKKKDSDTWSEPILAADGVVRLGTAEAAMCGLSGANEQTTPASAGPVRFNGRRLPSSKKLGSAITYDYNTKQTIVPIDSTLKRKACWNPVLYEMPDGELWLFFKIGASVGDWTGWLCKSKDGGRTWGQKEPLPERFLGPIKNKPVLVGDRLLCGSSTEGDGWRFHMEILDLKTHQWKRIDVPSTEAIKTDDNQLHPIDCIQPSILQLKDGRLQVMMRTHNARLATSFSDDGGLTWSPVTLSEVENNQSGTDAVTLQDGRHVLIYNNFATLPLTKKGPRTPLSVAISDDGQHWRHWLTLEDSPIDQYSYPAIIQGRNGHLHAVYTWRRQRMKHVELILHEP